MRKGDPAHFEDNPEEIDACLHCAKPKCNNCLENAYRGRESRNVIIDAGELTELYNDGVSVVGMAARLGVHPDTLRKRMREFGFSAAHPRRPISKGTFTALDPVQRKYLSWKGEKLA